MEHDQTTQVLDRAGVQGPTTSDEDPPAHVILWQLSTAAVVSRCLHVVARLGVADVVGPEGGEVSTIARAVGADPDSLGRMLRALASHGVFEVDLPMVRHTEASRLLRNDHPRSMGAFAHMMGLPCTWGSVARLDDTAITGRAGILDLDPHGLFPYLGRHPDQAEVFDRAMAAKSQADIGGVLDAFDFGSVGSVADVGGGAGHLVRAVVERHPDIRATLVDLAPVIRRVAESAPGGPAIDLVAADFFTDQLPVADAYVLMEIIHDWDDADAIRILSNLRRHVPDHATVLIVEQLLTGRPGPNPAATLDIVMLSVTGGRERSAAEHGALLDAAGFAISGVLPTTGAVEIIEARPA